MDASDFIGYVGSPEIHDGEIVALNQAPNGLTVEIKSDLGAKIVITFSGVTNIKSHEPVGMMLYSLTEMRGDGVSRKFCFANWDEDSQAFLEVDADDFICEVTHHA